MSERDTLPADIHPEVALLPWYVNGTLGTEERQQVARHLEACPDCRRELEELTQLKRELTAAYRTQPEPSSQLARSVFAKVAQESPARRRASSDTGSWLNGLDQWFRSLFVPQWVPTLAATLILAQLGLLLWVTMPEAPSEQVTTRSIGGPAATFRVTFEERATEQDIRAILTQISGRIVDGPDAAHAYVIQVTAPVAGPAEGPLQILRQRTGVVRTAEPVAP